MSLHDFFLLLLSRFLLPKCQPSFPCRNFTLEFPFTDSTNPDCGMFVVNGCNDSNYDHPTVDIRHRKTTYSILDKTSTNQILIHDSELQTVSERRKCYSFSNAPPSSSPSVSFKFASPNVTVFPCFNKSANEIIERQFQRYNRTDCAISTVYFESPAPARVRPNVGWNDSFPCGVSYVPIKSGRSSGGLFDLVAADYTLEWRVADACYDCHYRRGGKCVTVNWNEFYCETGTVFYDLHIILIR